MRPSVLAAVLAACVLSCSFGAQAADAPTAEHRRLYAEINATLNTLTRQVYSVQVDDAPVPLEIQTWSSGADGDIPEKMVSRAVEDHGDTTQEFYFGPAGSRRELRFIFEVITTQAIDGSHKTVQENRYYFRDGKMFRWLDPSKQPVPPESSAFKDKANALKMLTHDLLAYAPQADRSSKAPQAAGQVEEISGTFVGIEEGDYIHLFLKRGKRTLGFYVLDSNPQIDLLLADPEQYQGKPITVMAQTSIETLESAGGPVKITKILTVRFPQ